MGSVYVAENVRLGKRVAVKVLSQSDADGVRQLEREARVATAVGHPHIVDVIDFNRDGDTPYMVMELLEGEDLEATLRREGALDPTRVLHIVRQVADALEAVHARGVVHRDLKPGNIFLCAQQAFADYVKVLDFGVSRAATLASFSIAQGSLVGTPHYMAPEQAEPELGDVGPWTDVYALAAVAHRMLSGRAPFDSARTMSELLYAVVNKPAPELDATLAGPTVAEVVSRAMSKHPARRPQSASDFAAALARELGEGSVASSASQPRTPAPAQSAAGRGAETVDIGGAKTLPAQSAAGVEETEEAAPVAVPATVQAPPTPAPAPASKAPTPDRGSEADASAGQPPPRRGWLWGLLGLALLGGAAATLVLWPRAARPCHADDLDDCQRQCRAGHGRSCASWLRLLASRSGNAAPGSSAGSGSAASAAQAATISLLTRLCQPSAGAGAGTSRLRRDTRATACSALARRYQAGRGVAVDVAQAAVLYRRGCEAGGALACSKAGQMYARGEGVARDGDRAAKLLRRACKRGLAPACYHLGALRAGAGDVKAALPRYREACKRRVAAACRALAILHDRGDGVTKNAREASRLYQRACTLGDSPSCESARRLLALSAWGEWARSASVEVTSVAVTGPLAQAVVSRGVKRQIGPITFCYQQKLLRDRDLAGKVTLRFVVDRGGRARDAKVARASLRAGSGVGACIARLSRRWRFEPPRFGRSARVTLKLRFSSKVAVAASSTARPPRTLARPSGRQRGWLYVGDFSGGRWRTRYLRLGARTRPGTLAGRVLLTAGRCNLRSGPPSAMGAIQPIVGGLPAGTRVRLVEVKSWLDTGYMWARVQVLPSR